MLVCQSEKWMLNVSYLIRRFCDTKQIAGLLMMVCCSSRKSLDSFCVINKKKNIGPELYSLNKVDNKLTFSKTRRLNEMNVKT